MNCSKCGQRINKGDTFCTSCGTKYEDILEEKKTSKKVDKKIQEEFVSSENVECEKNHFDDDVDFSILKSQIELIFKNNKVLSFIMKFAVLFALCYPIYLIFKNNDYAVDLVTTLDNVGVLLFYGYYSSLMILYAQRRYTPLMLALVLRITNSCIIMYNNGVTIDSLSRFVIISFIIYFIYKEFSDTNEGKDFKNKYNEIKENLIPNQAVKVCDKCGFKNAVDDLFCSKCGKEINKVKVETRKSNMSTDKKFMIVIAIIVAALLFIDNFSKNGSLPFLGSDSSSIVGSWSNSSNEISFSKDGSFSQEQHYGTYKIYDDDKLVLIYNDWDYLGEQKTYTWSQSQKGMASSWYISGKTLYLGKSTYTKK